MVFHFPNLRVRDARYSYYYFLLLSIHTTHILLDDCLERPDYLNGDLRRYVSRACSFYSSLFLIFYEYF